MMFIILTHDNQSTLSSFNVFEFCDNSPVAEKALPGSTSFVWVSSSFVHCLATLDFRAGVEQPFGCLNVQNRQAMQSMGKSMDWTLEDDMVDSLFFCATLTGRRGGHTPFVQAKQKRPIPVRRRLSQTQALLGRVILGGFTGVLWGCPPTPYSFDNLPTAPHVCCCCQRTHELLCNRYKWVSRFEAPCNSTRWTGECWVKQMSRHGVLEIVRLHCDEAQQVGCLWGLESCPLV